MVTAFFSLVILVTSLVPVFADSTSPQNSITNFFDNIVQFFKNLFQTLPPVSNPLENQCKTAMGEQLDLIIKITNDIAHGVSDKDQQENKNTGYKLTTSCKDLSNDTQKQYWSDVADMKFGYPTGVNACKEAMKKQAELDSNSVPNSSGGYTYTPKQNAEFMKIIIERSSCKYYSKEQQYQFYHEAMNAISNKSHIS
jgi:hypothetical protein